jgi:hypothetical protein
VSEAQHKTSGIQIALLCVLLLLFFRPEPKGSGYADPAAPPTGVYRCWTGGFDHLAAGTLTLDPEGRYESYRSGGGGHYSYSTQNATIDFLDGDYHYWEYRGVYQRTHDAGAVTATMQADASLSNSLKTIPTQPDLPDERIVLMPLGAADPIGAERPGEYQYCYREDGQAGLSAR